MEYEILRSYSGDDLSDYCRACRFRRKRRPRPREASPALQAGVSAVFLLLGSAGLWFSLSREGTVLGELLRWLSLFWLVLGALLLLGNLGVVGPAASRSSREKWAAENSRGHYRFSETGFASYIGDAAYACNYAAVEALLEDGGHFYLFMNQNTAHILRKSAFTRGDPESFRSFLEERTGQTSLQIEKQ